jgi:hypothetical protein
MAPPVVARFRLRARVSRENPTYPNSDAANRGGHGRGFRGIRHALLVGAIGILFLF